MNWFDISAPEGKLSLNDKISDIMRTKEGRGLFENISSKMQANQMGGVELNEDMMKMLGGFSLIRFLSMSDFFGISFTKEELLSLNKQLNKINKNS